MSLKLKPLSQVNHEAIRLLAEQMGIVDALRFVNQFSTGHGNYTEERALLFDNMTLDDILRAIATKRAADDVAGGASAPDKQKRRKRR
jgi:hypothetical protein